MQATLPPGPRLPPLLQTIGWWNRPTVYVQRLRARYGPRFTMRLLGQSPAVILSDPDDLREVFTAPPDVLHPGEGARLLEPIVGPNSVILLDEAPHLEQRKLMLPAFHGERMQAAHRSDVRVDRSRARQLARRRAGRAPRAVTGPDDGDHPARGLRPRRGRAPRPPARAPDVDPVVRRQSDLACCRQAQRLLAGRGRFGRFEEDKRAGRPRALRADGRAPPRGRRARRRARHAARRPSRGRLADVRRGDPRRAAHRAWSPATRRPPRRWPSPSSSSPARPRRPRAPRRRRRGRRRPLPRRHHQRGPAPPPGAPQRRAASGQAGGRRSAAGPTRRTSC